MVFRSDDRGMSHSAHIGRELSFGAGLSLSLNTPTAPRFHATAAPFLPTRWRSTLVNTFEGPVALAGQPQPRFNLVVTHAGIDDRELGALGDGTAAFLFRVEESRAALSRVTARRFGSRRSAPAVS